MYIVGGGSHGQGQTLVQMVNSQMLATGPFSLHLENE